MSRPEQLCRCEIGARVYIEGRIDDQSGLSAFGQGVFGGSFGLMRLALVELPEESWVEVGIRGRSLPGERSLMEKLENCCCVDSGCSFSSVKKRLGATAAGSSWRRFS